MPLTGFPESEPRDAGTDQRSSGIIRLHTIKQIIDRVSTLLNPGQRIICFYIIFILPFSSLLHQGQTCAAGHHPECCRQAELCSVVPHRSLP